MKTKQNKFSSWKPKSKLSLRDRKRRKQYKLHKPTYHKPIDYLNQHLDLYNFKKFRCNKDKCRDYLQCFDYHNDQDHIRDPKEIYYSPEKCPDNCGDDDCEYSHNDFEKWYHPELYKRVFCKSLFNVNNSQHFKGSILYCEHGKCHLRDFCPFAHNEEEIRTELFYNYDIDDDFMMFKYKTEICPLTCIEHDHEKCLYSHSESDHRRMTILFAYFPKLCDRMKFENEQQIEDLLNVMEKLIELDIYEEEMMEVFQQNINFLKNKKNELKNSEKKSENKKTCDKGLECTNCHNILEFLFHPSIYKSIQCEGIKSNKKNPKNILKMIDDDLNLFSSPSNTNQINKKSEENKCDKEHCPFSHETDKFESIQESTDPPFYKFAYNRIVPGTFFQGRSFFSNRSENIIYKEDRLIQNQNNNYNFHSNANMMYNQQFAPQMDPQKLYFKNLQNSWQCFQQGNPHNKENVNYMNFASPVNMNMYRIQMNNTFLMSNQNNGYGQKQQYSSQQQGFGNGYQTKFYRC
jgi:hypothetical protein